MPESNFSGEHDRAFRPVHEGNVVSVIKPGEDRPQIGTVKCSGEDEWKVVLFDKNISLPLDDVLSSILVVADKEGEAHLSDTRDHHILRRVKKERAYQEEKYGTNQGNPHTVVEWAQIIKAEAEEAIETWLGGGGMLTYHKVMNEVLQAVAIGWAAMEQHAVLTRDEIEYIQEGVERADHYNREDFEALISGLDLDEYAKMCRAEIMIRSGMGAQSAHDRYPDEFFREPMQEEVAPEELAEKEMDALVQ